MSHPGSVWHEALAQFWTILFWEKKMRLFLILIFGGDFANGNSVVFGSME